MSRRYFPRRFKFAMLVMLSAGYGWSAAVTVDGKPGEALTEQILISEVTGTVVVRPKGGEEFIPVTQGALFDYGAEFKTEAESQVLVALSPNNTVRLMDRTKAILVRDDEHFELVGVKLDNGEAQMRLDAFPGDHSFKVDTPSGSCTAVGTRFSVVHIRHTDGMAIYVKVECEVGEVIFSGMFVNTYDDTIKAGSVFEFLLLYCPLRRYAFLAMVSIQGQSLALSFHGPHRVQFADGASGQVAMANVPGDTEFVGIRVTSGQVLVEGGSVILSEDVPARFVRGNALLDPDRNAEDYLNAAEWLCRQCLNYGLDGLNPEAIRLINGIPAPVPPNIPPVIPPFHPIPPLRPVPIPPIPDVPESPAEPAQE